jgi:outer membrane protein assembly factor BamB
VYAVRAVDGCELWRSADRNRRVVFSAPLVVGNRVVLATAQGVEGLDRATGQRAWLFAHRGGYCCSPLAVFGRVYAAGADGVAYALDPDTGAVIWRHNYAAGATATPSYLKVSPTRANSSPMPLTPASDGAALFLPVLDQGRVVALALGTGGRLWTYAAGDTEVQAVTVAADGVLVPQGDGRLVRLDRATGRPDWESAGRPFHRQPASVSGPAVFAGDIGLRLSRVDLRTGKGLWDFDAEREKHSFLSVCTPPLLTADGAVFAAAGSRLYCVTADRGELRWVASVGDDAVVTAPPCTDGQRLYVSAAVHTRGERAGVAGLLIALGQAR